MPNLPAISGKQLAKLLQLDGWVIKGRSTHGIALHKRIDDKNIVTTIPDKKKSLPDGTLHAILSMKQTQLGNRGLQKLIDTYGIPANE